MSADQRSSQTPTGTQTRTQSQSDRDDQDDRVPTKTDVELEFQSPAESTTRSNIQSGSTAAASSSPEPALSHRIEQTKLQAQVTALERALETSEYRQHEIVTQYERLLAERTDEETARDGSTESEDGLLKRLLERWR